MVKLSKCNCCGELLICPQCGNSFAEEDSESNRPGQSYYDGFTKVITRDGTPQRCAPWAKDFSRQTIEFMYGSGAFIAPPDFDIWEYRRSLK